MPDDNQIDPGLCKETLAPKSTFVLADLKNAAFQVPQPKQARRYPFPDGGRECVSLRLLNSRLPINREFERWYGHLPFLRCSLHDDSVMLRLGSGGWRRNSDGRCRGRKSASPWRRRGCRTLRRRRCCGLGRRLSRNRLEFAGFDRDPDQGDDCRRATDLLVIEGGAHRIVKGPRDPVGGDPLVMLSSAFKTRVLTLSMFSAPNRKFFV